MIESALIVLLQAVVIAIVIYAILWVLQTIAGIALPPKVVQLIWIAYAIICLILIVRLLLPLRLAGAMLLMQV